MYKTWSWLSTLCLSYFRLACSLAPHSKTKRTLSALKRFDQLYLRSTEMEEFSDYKCTAWNKMCNKTELCFLIKSGDNSAMVCRSRTNNTGFRVELTIISFSGWYVLAWGMGEWWSCREDGSSHTPWCLMKSLRWIKSISWPSYAVSAFQPEQKLVGIKTTLQIENFHWILNFAIFLMANSLNFNSLIIGFLRTI